MSIAYSIRKTRAGLPRFIAPGGQVSEMIIVLVLTLAVTAGAVAGRHASAARLLVGALGGIVFFLIAMSGRVSALRLAIVWLVLLGLVRRLLIPFAGWSEKDPLLLVGPAFAFLIWWVGRQYAPRRKTDALTMFAIFFLFWTIAQVFNPLQGSLIDGALGSLFWIPPLLWFFAGKTFDVGIHKKIMNILFWISIPVAIHGLYQTYVGLLPFELTWVGVSGFGESIFYEGFKIRSFATLTSPQEYGQFLAFVNVMLFGSILAGEKFRIARIGLFGFLSWALFLQGSRSIFGLFIIAIVIMSVVWMRNMGARLAMIGMVVVAFFMLKQVEPPPVESGGSGASLVINHQLQGLLNPSDEQGTGPLHFLMITEGFKKSIDHPLGLGTAPSTIITLKKAQSTAASTENDLSTIFVAFGVPAGILFIFFLVTIYSGAARRFKIHRSAYAIGVLGVFIAFFGQIWSGSAYCVSALIWMTIGAMSRGLDEELVLDQAEAEDSTSDVASDKQLVHATAA